MGRRKIKEWKLVMNEAGDWMVFHFGNKIATVSSYEEAEAIIKA